MLLAQVGCPQPAKPAVCGALVPGTPLPFVNPAAPGILDLNSSNSYELVILGHSENRGYAKYLKQRLLANPLVPGKAFTVYSDWIGGTEAWSWAAPGQRGYQRITQVLQRQQNPMIVLGLFSNNATYPIRSASTSGANFMRFASELEAIADRLHNSGKGAMMVYLSSHRYKPKNLLPCYYEKCAVGHLISQVAAKKKAYIKAGPEQHDLHWCCYPGCYAPDLAHTNDAGDRLMAQTWYDFLLREMTGAVMEPYGAGSKGSGGFVPVLAPAGGAPNLGNASFSVEVREALGAATLVYAVGTRRAPGPLLVSLDVLIPGKAGGLGAGNGSHRLSLAVPKDPALMGVGVYVQAAVEDSAAAPLGLALSQGLALVVGR